MTNEQWEQVSSRARAVLNYGIEQKEWLERCRTARLITATPFLAGCDKAMTTALSHLTIYLLSLDESTKDIYFHQSEDDSDIYSRLHPLSHFKGGDKSIIQCSMDLLALIMISNYKKDSEKDAAIGKYNPLSSGEWDYDLMSKKLLMNIENSITPEISAIITVEEALKGYWQQ
ncbi:MAG: hypothetical protein JEY99_09765 [Spirochaetales bacterium]|nr:hypothetical protein [Spirochaetales bacterium]